MPHLSASDGNGPTRPSAAADGLHGLLAEFSRVEPLLAAAREMRDAGYTKWDTHTPFPVHGLDQAMGIKPTRLPWIVLAAGLAGLCGALLMQWWMNAVDYPYAVSGKPLWSLPANVPVGFELAVLASALAAFFGTLALNRLPELYHPLLRHPRFRSASNDRFFIFIDNRDALFDPVTTRQRLESFRPDAIEAVVDPATKASYSLPRPVLAAAAVGVALAVVPFALVARARHVRTAEPRIHVVPDMDWQPKLKPQTAAPLFADGRAMRPHPADTVARGDLRDDPVLFDGRAGTACADAFPQAVTVNSATAARGRQRFGIYCAPCHGLSGHGDGITARRAEALSEGKWVPPASMHTDPVRQQPLGQVFNTVTHGIRTMPAHGPQIRAKDRWAVILYVKALQLSQQAPLDAVPEGVAPTLRQ